MTIVARMTGFPRPEYNGPELSETTFGPTPLHQMLRWYHDALERESSHGDIIEPSAMHLATAGTDGTPHVRVVLMRFLDARGPGFVSDSRSTKAVDMQANPRVSASITWLPLFRAVHFRGTAELMGAEEIEEYWRTRPYGAQMTSIAVEQSATVPDRQTLELRFAEAVTSHKDSPIPPRPDYFTGWRITCDEVEFWSGRPHRLHDRLLFKNPGSLDLGEPGWEQTRLMP